jgi:hypothetical protein
MTKKKACYSTQVVCINEREREREIERERERERERVFHPVFSNRQ